MLEFNSAVEADVHESPLICDRVGFCGSPVSIAATASRGRKRKSSISYCGLVQCSARLRGRLSDVSCELPDSSAGSSTTNSGSGMISYFELSVQTFLQSVL